MYSHQRKSYASKKEAVIGAIQQMEKVALVGAVESIKDSKIRLALSVNSQFKAAEKQKKLMAKLGERNRIANENRQVSELTSEMVYPGRKF